MQRSLYQFKTAFVSEKKRIASYILLLLFGFLFLKNLLPDLARYNHDNHDEIGHIHFFNIQDENSEKQQSHSHAEENCSSGKSVFLFSTLPAEVYKIQIPALTLAFDFVFSLTNNFQSPDLEPRKKPPRLA